MKWESECGLVTLHTGSCLDVLPTLAANSVHRVVTSPPYFALRSYLPDNHADKASEIGSEPTAEAFIATMVAVFREVKRVLRDDGVLFLNLGDGYADDEIQNLPHRVAESLRADGWIWRQTIVWAKRSPMPESVSGTRWTRCRVKVKDAERAVWRDCPGCPKCGAHGGYVLRRGKGRCTTAHEYVFVFAKSDRYFWDSAASAEKASHAGKTMKMGDNWDTGAGGHGRYHRNGREHGKANGAVITTRNPRSVWTLSSEQTKIKHFAAYPSELVRRCLVSGPGTGGVCSKCRTPLAPVVASERVATRPGTGSKIHDSRGDDEHGKRDAERHCTETSILGYRPTCECGASIARPLCLDPFNGIGTTGQTAVELGYDYIGIELNEAYIEASKNRIVQPPRWKLRRDKRPTTVRVDIGPLFAERLTK